MISQTLTNTTHPIGIVNHGPGGVMFYDQYTPMAGAASTGYRFGYVKNAFATGVVKSRVAWGEPIRGVGLRPGDLLFGGPLLYNNKWGCFPYIVVPFHRIRFESVHQVGLAKFKTHGTLWAIRTGCWQGEATYLRVGKRGGCYFTVDEHGTPRVGVRARWEMELFSPMRTYESAPSVMAKHGQNFRLYVYEFNEKSSLHNLVVCGFGNDITGGTLSGLGRHEVVRDIDVSPDGRTLVAAVAVQEGWDVDQTHTDGKGPPRYTSYAKVFDISDMANIELKQTYQFPASRVSYAPDGLTVAVLGASGPNYHSHLNTLTQFDVE